MKAYVYGPGGDVVLAVADVDGDGLLDRSAYHADDLGNVVAVSNGQGNVLESYSYDDYGAPHIYNAAGSPIALSAIGNVMMFGGRRYDAASGLYDFEARHYDPRAGRFISRDPLGAWGDEENLGNGHAYVNDNPQSLTDPTGMAEQTRAYLYSKFEDGKMPTQDDFVERGDKPTQGQFGSLIDSMVNKITDRYLLGLKEYDPIKQYLAGDTMVYGNAIYRSIVFGGGVPTGGFGGAMQKGKVKFFNETKGFGF